MDYISILIVDNHKIIREGLKSLLGKVEDIVVIGDTDFENMSRLAIALKPTLVLLCATSDGEQGINRAMRVLYQDLPTVPFLILARSVDDTCVLQAFRLGALGCLTSESDTQDLLDSIYELARGGSYVPSLVGRKLIQNLSSPNAIKENALKLLTPQQLRVMTLISQGYTNQEIAKMMVISKRTVEMHTYRLFRRLKVSNRAQAIQVALRSGIIEMNEEALLDLG